MEVTIKTANVSDIEQLAPLFDAYRVFYKQQSDLDLAKEFLMKRIDKSESVIFIALTESGEAVGFTQLYPSFSSVSVKRLWILNDLYVNESVRGYGVAKKLMNKAKEFAISTNTKGLSLATQINNSKAQKLYESIGYEKDTEFFHYFLNV